jgi:hypothetical protein
MAFKTYGELRQQLKAEGIRWTVNPAFPDDAPIKRPGLGADLTKVPVAKNIGPVDVAALVAKFPTTNTLLREHLIERGFLPGTLKTISGSSLIPKLPHCGDSGQARGTSNTSGKPCGGRRRRRSANFCGLAQSLDLELRHRHPRSGSLRALLGLCCHCSRRVHGSHRALRLVRPLRRGLHRGQ